MKKILYALVALVIILVSSTGQVLAAPLTSSLNAGDSSYSQTPAGTEENRLLWNQPWGKTVEEPDCISADKDGNVYVMSRNWLAKFDAYGYEKWSKPLLGLTDSQYKVDASQDGAVYICVSNSSLSEIRKYDTEGNLLWWHSLASPAGSFLYLPAIAADPSDNVYAAGTCKEGLGDGSNDTPITLIKYDGEGNQLWKQQIGTDYWKSARGLAAGNNYVYVLGDSLGCFDLTDKGYCFLGNYSAVNGEEQWVERFGAKAKQLVDYASDIAIDSSGNAYAMYSVGYSYANLFAGETWYMTKYDDLGTQMWTPIPLSSDLAVKGDLAVDSEQNVYVSLWHNPSYYTATDYSIDKYDYYGNWKLSKTLDAGYLRVYFPGYISIGKNDDIYFTGHWDPDGTGRNGYPFVAKFEGNADTDEDGLLDRWETEGVTVGGAFVNLPAMGADPEHKDIFVEVDWMPTQQPKPGAFDKVIQAFLDAPVDNPDGIQGINIHIDSGRDSIMDPTDNTTWGDYSQANEVPHVVPLGSTTLIGGAYDWSDFDKIKGSEDTLGNFRPERAPIFHYCLFADKLGGLETRSGISRGFGASDFMVALGSFHEGSGGYAWEQGATFMHELGHNLGLVGDNKNPNYLSLMNYSFQIKGLYKYDAEGNKAPGVFDYSRFSDLNDLDETNLVETEGIYSQSGNPDLKDLCTIYWAQGPGKSGSISNGLQSIDWDLSGSDNETIARDIDGNGSANNTFESYDDWSNLQYKVGSIGALGAEEPSDEDLPVIEELTEEESALIPETYQVGVTAPDNSGIQPSGSDVTYSFTVTNIGTEDDTYDITLDSSAGWADLDSVPSELSLAAGESGTIEVTVSVGASSADQDVLTLKAGSQTFNRIWDSGVVTTVIQVEAMTEQQITDYTDVNHKIGSAATDGDWVVWLDGAYSDSTYSLLAYNFASGEQSTLSSGFDNYGYGMVDISGSKVVYCKSYSGGGIYLYDLDTSTETRISTTGAGPRIYGDNVVYYYNGDIYLYNISSGTKEIILACGVTEIPDIGSEYAEYRFGWDKYGGDIYGDKVVSIQMDDEGWNPYYNVVVYDISESTLSYVTAYDYPYNAQNVQIYGDTVVWEDDRTDKWVVYAYDLSTGEESIVTTYTDLYRYNSYYHWPDIYNGKVVAKRYNEGGNGINKLYLYDLADGSESLVSSNVWGTLDGNGSCLDFGSNQIIYLKGTATQRNLYVTTLESGLETSLSTDPAAPESGWFNTQPEITLTANKEGVSSYYQWDSNDDETWVGYAGAFSAPEGEHTLYYYSADALNNTESVKSDAFNVDITPPVTSVSTTPPMEEVFANLFKLTPAVTLSTGEEDSVTYYQWDSQEEGSWNTYTESFYDEMEGEHTLYYYSEDAYGVVETVKSLVLNVDTTEDNTAPATDLSCDPDFPEDGGLFMEAPVVTLTSDETSVIFYQWDTPPSDVPESAVSAIEWSNNPYPVFAPFTIGPTIYRGGFLTPAGTHTLYYFSMDAAGNMEEMRSQTFTVAGEPPNGMLAWWQAEGDASDTMGNYDGQLEGEITFTEGESGQAFDFSGDGQYVSLPGLDIQTNENWSITSWFKLIFSDNSTYSDNYTSSDNDTSSDNTTLGGVIFGIQDAEYGATPAAYWSPLLYVGTDGCLHGGLTEDSITDNQTLAEDWHLAALTFSDNITLYLDGEAIGSVTAPEEIREMPVDQIGTGYAADWDNVEDGWYDFTGQIDDTALFERTLSASEIADIYHNGLPGRSETLTFLSSSANPATVRKTVTLTASVMPGYGSFLPTGTVNFMEGATLLGSSELDSSGTATFVTSSLSKGSHAISAVYEGDEDFLGSSDSLTQTIRAATSSGGGGGGSGTRIITITSTSFNSSITLATDASGYIQGAPIITTKDLGMKIIIPSGTRLLNQGRILTNIEAVYLESPSAPAEGEGIAAAYQISPAAAASNKAMTLIMAYNPAELPEGMEEASLHIAYLEGTTWVPLESQVDTAGKTVTAEISRFGTMALTGTIATSTAPTATTTPVSSSEVSEPLPPVPASPTASPAGPTASNVMPTVPPSPSITPAATLTPVTPTPAPVKTISWGLIIGIIAAIIVVALAVILIGGHRSKIHK